MADTEFPEAEDERPDELAALWPFPGNLFLVVLAAWLFYMGSVAGMEDVTTAFYGLGAVIVLVLLFALRAMAVGRVGRRRRADDEWLGGHGRRAAYGEAEGFGAPRRSAIPDEGPVPVEGAVYPADPAIGGASRIARSRARQEVRSVVIPPPQPAREPEPAANVTSSPEPAANGRSSLVPAANGRTSLLPAANGRTSLVPAAADDQRPADQRPAEQRAGPDSKRAAAAALAEPVAEVAAAADTAPPQEDATPAEPASNVAAMPRQLEVRINRERAERGAQLAKLEALLREEVASLRAVVGIAETPGRTIDPETIDGLTARLDALEAKGRTDGSQAEPPMRLAQFNNMVGKELMPRIEQIIDKRVASAVDPLFLRKALGLDVARLSPPASEAEGEILPDDAIGERVAAAHAAIASANEVARIEREAIRAEVEKLQRSAQRALSIAMTARRTIGEIADSDAPIAEQLATLREGLGGRPGSEAAPDAPSLAGQVVALGEAFDELRGNVAAVTQHVARMGEHYQELVARIDGIAAGEALDEAGAPGPRVEAEVDALRDALTTLIEENRELRAQQEMLSSRIGSPGGGTKG